VATKNLGGLGLEKMNIRKSIRTAASVVLLAAMATAQTAYQPKFKGDPARSDSEAAALGYLRTFLRAQKVYKKKNGHYATTLMDLSKTGSFTRRMASSTDRGDYTVKFRPHKDKDAFEITMVPKQADSTHRSFFSDDQGKIRVDETKEADASSQALKAD
jgi:type II secretory pathway pseudopilin PulG